jgi:hypothetical protein
LLRIRKNKLSLKAEVKQIEKNDLLRNYMFTEGDPQLTNIESAQKSF